MFYEVIGFKICGDGNDDQRKMELWRRKIKALDADLARVKVEKWERRNFLKNRIDDHMIEVRPIPILKPKPVVSIQRLPVSRVRRDAI